MLDFAEGILVPALIGMVILAGALAGVWAVVTVTGSIAVLLAFMVTGASALLEVYQMIPVGALPVAALLLAAGILSLRRADR